MRTNRRVAMWWLSALALTLVPAAPAVAQVCGPVRADTLHLHVTASRDVVRLGQDAKLSVTVYRSVGHKDLMPVEDADVLVTAKIGRSTLGSGAGSNGDGTASISMNVPHRVGTGVADVKAIAMREASYCVQEYGETIELSLFKVRR